MTKLTNLLDLSTVTVKEALFISVQTRDSRYPTERLLLLGALFLLAV